MTIQILHLPRTKSNFCQSAQRQYGSPESQDHIQPRRRDEENDDANAPKNKNK